MYQDIFPAVYDNSFKLKEAEDGDRALLYKGQKIMIRLSEGQIIFPRVKELPETVKSGLHYLFGIDGHDYAGMRCQEEVLAEGFEYVSVQMLRGAVPKAEAFAGIVGLSLTGWYESRKFCGRCGSRMQHSLKERMVFCPECHQIEYPKISPAVIIGVTKGDQILFSKYSDRNYHRYALLAGFNEIGETIEETVHREVMEEVGLKVKNLKYYKSQPWPYSDSLLMGFFCEADGDDEIRVDHSELAMAGWFDRDEMPVKEEDMSLTNEMMMAFKKGLV